MVRINSVIKPTTTPDFTCPIELLEAIVDEFSHYNFELITGGGNTIFARRSNDRKRVEFWTNPEDPD